MHTVLFLCCSKSFAKGKPPRSRTLAVQEDHQLPEFSILGSCSYFCCEWSAGQSQQQPGYLPLSPELLWGHMVQEDSQTWDMTPPIIAVPGMMAKGERPSQDTTECTSLSSCSFNSLHDSDGSLFPISDSLKAACHIISCMLIIIVIPVEMLFLKDYVQIIIFLN